MAGPVPTVSRRQPAVLWTNWGGNQRCAPEEIRRPTTAAELVEAVRSAAARDLTVKAVGSGHSFTDVACTTGMHIRLDGYDRILGIDREAGRVTVQSGVTIAALSEALADVGLAMPNLGDIGYQSISGAISTGTHGTGAKLCGLAHQVAALELVAGDGTIVSASATEEPDIFAAARLGVGAMGILSTITLQCVPAFRLRAEERAMRVDEVLSDVENLVEGNDHFEFYWVPHTGWALTKANNRTDEPVGGRTRAKEWFEQTFLENVAFGAVCRLGRARPNWIPRLATAVPSTGTRRYVARSDKVFTSPRMVRFCEMEYSMPREHLGTALNRLRQFIEDAGLMVSFPVEVRVAAPDDIPLSTSYGRQSCYIAIHMYRGMPYDQYFRGAEAIFSELEGRPHWGKLHYQTAATLAPRCPRWDAFQSARRSVDPKGRFANAYTDRVLGPI